MFRSLGSQHAQRIFAWSSWIVLLLGLFFLLMWSPWFAQLEAEPSGEAALRLLGGILGVVGAPALLVIWFGMIAFCLLEDKSPVRMRILWCVLFFTTGLFGAVLYFFRVYRKQVASRAA